MPPSTVVGQVPGGRRLFLLLARQVEVYADACEPLHRAPVTPRSPAARQIDDAPELPVLDTWTAPHLLLVVVAEDHLRLLAAAVAAPKVALGVNTAGRVVVA